MRLVCAVVLVVGLAVPARAQVAEQQGWSFSGSFRGSANSSGTVLKAEPVLGYVFNNHLETYAGLPFYFVNVSSPVTATTVTTGSFMNGIGNALLGFRLAANNDTANYSSTLEFTAPTGDKSRGFSTGRVTADWTNRISHRFSSLTPFASAGVANTISDTAFFVRPFSSLGLIGHFDGGATYELSRVVRLSASAYAVRASGQQRIISRVVEAQPSSSSSRGRTNGENKNRVFETQTESVVPAEIANDHGFSTWIGVSPHPDVDFHAGYNRSVNYDLNSFFFGVGFHAGK